MDVVTLARTARESLARGLGALQTPGIPPELVQTAEPIASAMSGLHRVESTRGVGSGDAAVGALTLVRQALSQLQSAGVPHPAVDQAMEAIASSLGLVHQLSVLVGQASMAPSPPTQPSGAYQGYTEPKPQVAVVGQPQAQQAPPYQQQPAAHQQQPAYQQAPQPQAHQPQPAQGWGQPQQPQAWPQAQPAPQAAPAWQQPAPAQAAPAPAWQEQAPQPAPAAQPAAAVQPAAAPQPGWQSPALHAAQAAPTSGVLRVEAALGAHSATNFYKGLSGNDVIDSGGIFVATYNIPEVGQKLVIKVSLPGGYEFEVLGEVKWTRDAPNSGADSSPGFGAAFTQISPEARQLVYRYVRNREPLFHDDF